ncbi:hypothetical protein BGZ76_000030 [Entomortierella beljakovae]|nr:hypothetical protein BGZ76_000030 [Entomortierella beljakovae]
MSSPGDKDGNLKAGTSKDLLDLYDGADDLLDYGDTYDLDTELLDTDLADVENYDEFDLGPEDDLGLNATEESNSNTTGNQVSVNSEDANIEDAIEGETTEYPTEDKNEKSELTNQLSANNESSTQNDNRNEQYSQSQQNNQRDGNFTGYNNRQLNNGRPPYSGYTPRGGLGRGGPGGMRGRGQNYLGMGRGNFQGNSGVGPHNMMGMNMGMNMGMVNPAMAQGMNLGMNMNMGMGMMGMPGGRFPGDVYGNQGMGYYGGRGSGMDGNRVNPGMGMNIRGPNMGAQGRTIHINPKFQNRAGVPPIAGQGSSQSDRSQQSQYPQQQHQPRSHSQDQNRTQTRNWESKSNTSSSQGTRDSRSDDHYEPHKDDRNDRGSYNKANNFGSSQSPDRGNRDSGDSYRPSGRDRDERTRGSSDRRSDDNERSSSESRRESNLQTPYSSDRRSKSPNAGGHVSITSRLGLKRPGEEQDDSHKVHKPSGSSTPRSEQSRVADRDAGSVSFLRDKRGSTEARTATEPKGFVKVENLPESLSDASIRKLADGISGVDRVLTISKKGDRIIILGFASVDEAKFFRRQINRTTIEGSLVTVTLTSA